MNKHELAKLELPFARLREACREAVLSDDGILNEKVHRAASALSGAMQLCTSNEAIRDILSRMQAQPAIPKSVKFNLVRPYLDNPDFF